MTFFFSLLMQWSEEKTADDITPTSRLSQCKNDDLQFKMALYYTSLSSSLIAELATHTDTHTQKDVYLT